MVFAVLLYVGIIIASFLGVFIGLTYVGDGFTRWREANALADVPVATLDAVAVGEATVSGTLVAPEGATSVPVGEQPTCACYELTVSDSTDVESLEERRESVPAFVDDGDGRVRIDPEGFRLDLTDDRRGSLAVKSYDDPPAAVERYERDREFPDQGMRRDRTYEYEYLAPQDDVFAYGTVAVDRGRETTGDEKGVVLTAGDDGFLSNKSREVLARERRFSLAKNVIVGVTLSTVSLFAFLWLTGIAQLFLGA